MGGALVARDTRFTFHRSPVLEICHSRRWIGQMVGDLCQQRIPVDHAVVLRLGGICWRRFSGPGNLHAMGGALRASSHDRRGAILGRPQGLLFYRRRQRIARGVVCNARGADIARRWTLCSGFVRERSNNCPENKPVGLKPRLSQDRLFCNGGHGVLR